jgi:hypothetical protein
MPVIGYLPGGFESLIDPRKVEPDCVQRSVKAPATAPLYRPDHVPASFGVDCFEEKYVGAAIDVLLPQMTRRAPATETTGITRAILC